MARAYADYLHRGASIAAIVIDPPGQNAAMVTTLGLPFPVLSDPTGELAIKPFDLWDESQKMSKPGIVVLSPSGTEVYRYSGLDFMDRPDDSEILEALDQLQLQPLNLPIMTIDHMTPEPGRRAILLTELAVYMRGVRWATQALADRARDPHDRAEGERTAKMAERYVAAQGATRRFLGDE